ncbi:MAG TPA: PaaI family thioesterase [Candidatus Nanopelagicales bacterium]|nr:PaaI family thioesterase [Candidatus Nanopelagicales bacterium]
MSTTQGLQDRYAPNNLCFGCGPANEKGLRLKSIVEGDELVAEFTPEEHHQAFAGMLNGGIIGALLDCHSNWAAAHYLMQQRGEDTPPCTVTADFHVKLKKPTPIGPVHLRAKVVESEGDRAIV